jgi:tetratricopeptide (TPR) repeat protein
VLASIQDEDQLADVKGEAECLLTQACRLVDGEEGRRKVREKQAQLAKLRDDALFYSSLFTGLDLGSSLRATQEAARQGLALYGLCEGGRGAIESNAFVGEQQKTEILDTCHELYLILAEAVAHPIDTAPPLIRRRQAIEALALLDDAEKLGRATQALHRRRARYLEQAGRGDEAARAREQVEKVKPNGALDHFLIADEALRQGQLREASQGFEQVLRLKADHFWAKYFLAQCLLRQQRPAEARAHLTACLAQRDFLWVYLLRGFASGELHDFPAAEADYHQALERNPDALALYGLHVNRGVMRIRQQNYPGAVEDLRRAVSLRPGDFQAYVNLAEALNRQGLGRDALAELDRAVGLKPDMPALYRLRSAVRRAAGDHDNALADLLQAVRAEQAVKPGQTASPAAIAFDHVSAARLHLEKKNYPEALASCEEALKLQPGNGAAQRWKAEALLGLKRYSEAVAAFDRHLEHGRPTAEVLRSRGLTRAKLGRHAKAVEDLTHSLCLRPDAELHASRGWVHLVLQAPKFAQHDFEQAVKLEPLRADAYNGRAYAAVLLGETAKSLADVEHALKLEREDSRHVYNAARVYVRIYEREHRPEHQQQALDLIERALTLQPINQRATFWKQYVLSDPAMLPLRNTSGFTRLRDRFVGTGSERD